MTSHFPHVSHVSLLSHPWFSSSERGAWPGVKCISCSLYISLVCYPCFSSSERGGAWPRLKYISCSLYVSLVSHPCFSSSEGGWAWPGDECDCHWFSVQTSQPVFTSVWSTATSPRKTARTVRTSRKTRFRTEALYWCTENTVSRYLKWCKFWCRSKIKSIKIIYYLFFLCYIHRGIYISRTSTLNPRGFNLCFTFWATQCFCLILILPTVYSNYKIYRCFLLLYITYCAR